jgi:site-specific DNA recombinase
MKNRIKYFAYIRKSSDREDAQALSIDAQKRELEKYANKNNLKIIKIFEESASAYKTGRSKFNEIVKRVEQGEANGLLVYHLTRIARNSLDGGRIIYMMDEGLIKEIRTPERSYTSNSDDKFIMQIHFAMAKKSSDDTSQFVKRDIKSKILKGEYPVSAPMGYLNMSKFGVITGRRFDQEKQQLINKSAKEEGRTIRRIEQDPFLAPIIRKLYQEYSTGSYSIDELRIKALKMGLKGTRSDLMLSKSTILRILSNPIYYGAIPWQGEIHSPSKLPEETRHFPIIEKDLFDSVQDVLNNKSKPRKQVHFHKYTGIIRCKECGGMITAEIQKGKTYYRCTKKKKGLKVKCSQPYIREDKLEKQIQNKLKDYVIPEKFVKWALKTLNKNNENEQRQLESILSKQRKNLAVIEGQLAQLLKMKISPANINGELLNDEEYLAQKKSLLSEKETYQEKTSDAERNSESWLEQCEEFFDFAANCEKKWIEDKRDNRKRIFQIIFGSNAYLNEQKLLIKAKKPFIEKASLQNSFTWRGRPDSNRRPIA